MTADDVVFTTNMLLEHPELDMAGEIGDLGRERGKGG